MQRSIPSRATRPAFIVIALAVMLAALSPISAARASTAITVSGTVAVPDSIAKEAYSAIRVYAFSASGEYQSYSDALDANGSFALSGLTGGDYVLQVQAKTTYTDPTTGRDERIDLVDTWYGGRTRQDATQVSVSGDLSDLDLTIDEGLMISGQLSAPLEHPRAGVALSRSRPT